jgi:hydrogenase maturation protease
VKTRPWLVLAVGNPARGDDALGPLLLQALQDAGAGDGGDVECLEDYQLVPEHALDLRGRLGVLFADAAHPGHGVTLERVVASASVPSATHSLTPAGLLRVAQSIDGAVPPAWLLGIEGAAFGLGEGLSPAGRAGLALGRTLALEWLRDRRREAAEAVTPRDRRTEAATPQAQCPAGRCTTVTGTVAACSTACETEPSSTPRTGPSPRAPTTTRSQERRPTASSSAVAGSPVTTSDSNTTPAPRRRSQA